jgi:hypothetical protein
MPIISEKTYNECKTKIFGNEKTLGWGNRSIPSREAVNLILDVTGEVKSKYGPEDLAVVWAIETNFLTHPKNEGNTRGGKVVSVDIGPVQINYPQWLGPGMSAQLRQKVLGTNLKPNQVFNGIPRENLNYAWKYILPKLGGPVKYNAKSKVRPVAVATLKPKLKSFFDCMLAKQSP